jgi:hypothetical protein
MTDWATTERLRATVIFVDGATLDGDIHLQARAANHDGPETPLEMLNRAERFFSMTLPGDQVVFVSKSQVARLSCAREPMIPDPDRVSVARLVGLEVVMGDGARFTGFSTVELPPTRSRASDYLNAPEAFFHLETEDTTCYINRALVRLARPIN